MRWRGSRRSRPTSRWPITLGPLSVLSLLSLKNRLTSGGTHLGDQTPVEPVEQAHSDSVQGTPSHARPGLQKTRGGSRVAGTEA